MHIHYPSCVSTSESTLGQLQLQTASSADEIVRMREQAEMLGAELAPARKALSERLAAMTKTLAGVETMVGAGLHVYSSSRGVHYSYAYMLTCNAQDADIERLVGKRIFEVALRVTLYCRVVHMETHSSFLSAQDC